MLRSLPALLLGFMLAVLGTAGAGVPTAQRVIANAKAQAAAEHKTILLLFGASWCPWCKRLDDFIEAPKIQPIFARHFVLARIDVQEHGDKASLNTPGGAELGTQMGARRNGLPFFAFLDEQGELIVNSIRPLPGKSEGENIGHPTAPEEVDYFMQMLEKVSPPLSPAESQAIESYLRHQKK